MRFSDSKLYEAVAAWRDTNDPIVRSKLDNIWFEERVNASRQRAFEEGIGEVHTWDELRKLQVDYWETFVRVGDEDVPHTFLEGFVLRDLSAIDEKQMVVRIESLSRPLSGSALTFDQLRHAIADGEQDIVDRFLRSWNESSVRDARPVFATPKSAIADDLNKPDWPERLRDRLGLAHYDAAGGPEPIALMEYRLEEIVQAARSAGATCAVTAPCVLDSVPWPYFFPAPTELDCGRAMALFEIGSDEDLVVELLHVRLTYRTEHIIRRGEIVRAPAPLALAQLRNHHLMALHLASGRDDFGEDMSEHDPGTP